MADTPTPIQIDPSAFTPILIQFATKILAIAGGVLVAHGYATEGQVGVLIPTLAQEIAGTVLALGATGYAMLRSKWNNDKLLTIKESPNTRVPDSVAIVKGPTNA